MIASKTLPNGVKLIVEGVDKISDFRAVRAGKVSLVAGDAVCRSVEEVDRKTLGLKTLRDCTTKIRSQRRRTWLFYQKR